MKAVEANTEKKWVLLYIKRWLKAPVQQPDGTLQRRECGTPQGSAISPVLANLFLHYAFDAWMEREFPTVEFERYVDDIVVHCVTERQARYLRSQLAARMEQVGLRLHPDKTKIVYCQDDSRRDSYEHTSFTYLGYTFSARTVQSRHGVRFRGFAPAISKDALTAISRQVRRWRIHRRTRLSLDELADWINPIVRGWINYYGRFYRSMLDPLLKRINGYLVRWARKKYKRLAAFKRVRAWWLGLVQREPELFAHWRWTRGFAWIQ